jgi:hypothetical protein
MLRISRTREVWWPAVIHEPEDGGATKEWKLDVKIRLPRGDEPAQSDQDFVANHIVDWRPAGEEPFPFCNDAGEAQPFSPEHRAEAMIYAFVRIGFGAAIADCSRGIAAKN